MYLKKVPETDEGRIKALQAAIDREELNGDQEIILSLDEVEELRLFVTSYEGVRFILKQALKDFAKSQTDYVELFKNAQMYVSHFIQVLQLTVIRNEIKLEALSDYGFESGEETVLPDLSTEESVLHWGEKIIQGEAKRMSRGGYPLYNPAIAKVKVHYELFSDVVYSTGIYRQNVVRQQTILYEMQKKSESMIRDIWSRVEEKYGNLPLRELSQIYQGYKINYHSQKELL
ncbi:MAG: hypothetical protein LBG45_05160 [Dysgonamonadaceae bacterium]|jgi:uncharacterized protein YajQ (UPF0234 family)|nr:hypothetical protein [Dysgonamonadaceae bacterium]